RNGPAVSAKPSFPGARAALSRYEHDAGRPRDRGSGRHRWAQPARDGWGRGVRNDGAVRRQRRPHYLDRRTDAEAVTGDRPGEIGRTGVAQRPELGPEFDVVEVQGPRVLRRVPSG